MDAGFFQGIADGGAKKHGPTADRPTFPGEVRVCSWRAVALQEALRILAVDWAFRPRIGMIDHFGRKDFGGIMQIFFCMWATDF